MKKMTIMIIMMIIKRKKKKRKILLIPIKIHWIIIKKPHFLRYPPQNYDPFFDERMAVQIF